MSGIRAAANAELETQSGFRDLNSWPSFGAALWDLLSAVAAIH